MNDPARSGWLRGRLGTDQGAFQVPDDFDEPLPEDVLASFEE